MTIIRFLCISAMTFLLPMSYCAGQETNKNVVNIEMFEGQFASVNSFIFSNNKTLLVVDVQRTTKEAKRLADYVMSKKLPLTHVLITHGHTDHFMGIDVFHKQFPQTKIVVQTSAIKQDMIDYATFMDSHGWLDGEPALKPKSEKNPDGFDYQSIVQVLSSDTFELEGGGVLELTNNYKPSEAEHMTTIYSKDLNALFVSDFGYNKVHLWMGEGVTTRHIANWRSELEGMKIRYKEINPSVYPGHGGTSDVSLFDKVIEYIDNFTMVISNSQSRDEAIRKMKALYPDYKEDDFFLKYSVEYHMR